MGTGSNRVGGSYPVSVDGSRDTSEAMSAAWRVLQMVTCPRVVEAQNPQP